MNLKISYNYIKLLCLAIALHFTWLGLIGISYLKLDILLDIPFVNELIAITGLILSSFLIGYLILSIMNISFNSLTGRLICSVGLSLYVLMILGFILNLTYYFLKIDEPISKLNSIICISFLLLCIYILIYKYASKEKVLFDFEFNIFHLLIPISLPIFAIIGTHLMNVYNNNVLLLILLISISIVPLLITKLNVSSSLFPVITYMVAVSLLLHTSLISSFLVGYDIAAEYYISSIIQQSSFWDITYTHNLNSVISVTILPLIWSNMLNLSEIWIFKTIFIIVFAFVPVGLYEVYKAQMDQIDAFYSVFFLMSIFTFYTEMIGLARQQIAELFLVLVIYVVASNTISSVSKKKILYIVFSLGIIISHYGLSIVYLIGFIIAFIIYHILSALVNCNTKTKTIIFTFKSLLFYVVASLAWYIYISGASVFESITLIAASIFRNLINILGHDSTEALVFIGRSELSVTHEIIKVLTFMGQGFICIGIMSAIYNLKFKPKNNCFNLDYLAFSFSFATILIIALVIPGFANRLNIYRTYHIALLVLAPFFVLGVNNLFNLGFKLKYFFIGSCNSYKNFAKSRLFISIFLLIALLFYSGVASELVNDVPISISLNKNTYGLCFHTDQDELGAIWMANNCMESPIIWGSKGKGSQVVVPYFYPYVNMFEGDTVELEGYIFLSHEELINNRIISTFSYNWSQPRQLIDFSKSLMFENLYYAGSKIYNNGESQVFIIPYLERKL